MYLEKVGTKYASRATAPSAASSLASSGSNLSSTHGAPLASKGVVVPRPSETFVPSTRPMPGYISAVAGVGMLGEGGTQRRRVSDQSMFLAHPSIGTTSSSALLPPASAATNSPLKRSASSASVMPCRRQMGFRPTKVARPRSSVGPSTRMPPSGFGRSSTTTRGALVRFARMLATATSTS